MIMDLKYDTKWNDLRSEPRVWNIWWGYRREIWEIVHSRRYKSFFWNDHRPCNLNWKSIGCKPPSNYSDKEHCLMHITYMLDCVLNGEISVINSLYDYLNRMPVKVAKYFGYQFINQMKYACCFCHTIDAFEQLSASLDSEYIYWHSRIKSKINALLPWWCRKHDKYIAKCVEQVAHYAERQPTRNRRWYQLLGWFYGIKRKRKIVQLYRIDSMLEKNKSIRRDDKCFIQLIEAVDLFYDDDSKNIKALMTAVSRFLFDYSQQMVEISNRDRQYTLEQLEKIQLRMRVAQNDYVIAPDEDVFDMIIRNRDAKFWFSAIKQQLSLVLAGDRVASVVLQDLLNFDFKDSNALVNALQDKCYNLQIGSLYNAKLNREEYHCFSALLQIFIERATCYENRGRYMIPRKRICNTSLGYASWTQPYSSSEMYHENVERLNLIRKYLSEYLSSWKRVPMCIDLKILLESVRNINMELHDIVDKIFKFSSKYECEFTIFSKQPNKFVMINQKQNRLDLSDYQGFGQIFSFYILPLITDPLDISALAASCKFFYNLIPDEKKLSKSGLYYYIDQHINLTAQFELRTLFLGCNDSIYKKISKTNSTTQYDYKQQTLSTSCMVSKLKINHTSFKSITNTLTKSLLGSIHVYHIVFDMLDKNGFIKTCRYINEIRKYNGSPLIILLLLNKTKFFLLNSDRYMQQLYHTKNLGVDACYSLDLFSKNISDLISKNTYSLFFSKKIYSENLIESAQINARQGMIMLAESL